jgi:malate dehydrogenase
VYASLGESGIIEPTYVYLPGVPGGDTINKFLGGIDFFAVPVELGVLACNVH